MANPPYMGASNMGPWLSKWAKKNYPDSKSDLCTCFIERGFSLSSRAGLSAMVTMQSWMFISSFEKMRAKILSQRSIVTMAHLGTRAFSAIGGEVVSTTATVFSAMKNDVTGAYFRLVDMGSEGEKREGLLQALADPDCGWFYRADAAKFGAIPGNPIAYWASRAVYKAFAARSPLSSIGHPRVGVQTGENAKFLRLWWEVDAKKSKFNSTSVEDSVSSKATWFPYNKGGEYRKWYGNNDYVIDWINDGERIIGGAEKDGRKVMNLPEEVKFKPAVTWSKISSGGIAFRYKPHGHLFDVAGTSIFSNNDNLAYLQGAANSSVMLNIASLLSPTLNFEVGQIASYPILFGNPEQTSAIVGIVLELRHLSQADWDAREVSWDFGRNSLV